MTYEEIRNHIKGRGMTIAEVAEKIGQTRQNIFQKAKKGTINTNDLEGIAKATGCRLRIEFIAEDNRETD